MHLGESSAGINTISEKDEKLLLGSNEMASTGNSSKRNAKNLTGMKVGCSVAKKYKPSQEKENGVEKLPAEGK